MYVLISTHLNNLTYGGDSDRLEDYDYLSKHDTSESFIKLFHIVNDRHNPPYAVMTKDFLDKPILRFGSYTYFIRDVKEFNRITDNILARQGLKVER